MREANAAIAQPTEHLANISTTVLLAILRLTLVGFIYSIAAAIHLQKQTPVRITPEQQHFAFCGSAHRDSATIIKAA